MGRRRALGVVAIACALLVALILLATVTPEPIDRPYHAALGRLVVVVSGVPGLGWFDYTWLERLGNVLMFVPLGVLLELLFGVRRWWLVLVVAAALSTSVELVQLLWLPERTASLVDVITNTIGAGCGAAISALVTVVGRRRVSGRRARE